MSELTFRAAMINSCNHVIIKHVDEETLMNDELMDTMVSECKSNLDKTQYKVHPLAIREHITRYILDEFGRKVWFPND